MKNNVLYEQLPTRWKGYTINMDFQVGIQLMCALEDKELSESEKAQSICYLLFFDIESNSLREFPQDPKELEEMLQWYLNGWNHDKHKKQADKEKVIDFYVDQWRIYADFRQIYNINLNDCSLHWWEFMAMLWNMPPKLSSFMQVIDMRTKKPRKKASKEEIKAINEAKEVYGLEQNKPEYTDEQKSKIDEYDQMMEAIKKKKKIAKEVEALMQDK